MRPPRPFRRPAGGSGRPGRLGHHLVRQAVQEQRDEPDRKDHQPALDHRAGQLPGLHERRKEIDAGMSEEREREPSQLPPLDCAPHQER